MRAIVMAILLFCALATAALEVRAQDDELARQVWPEIDVYVPLNDQWRFIFTGSVDQARETLAATEGKVGVYADYFWTKRIGLRAGYQYGHSLGDSTPSSEHRILLDQNFTQLLGTKFALKDRNRQEVRWIKGDLSIRFRNRLTLEREFAFRGRPLVPYAAAEIYFDTRFHSFNRRRFTGGVQITLRRSGFWVPFLRKQRVLDLYFTRQDDSHSHPNHINVFGITFGIHF
jgi:hypothetical protein